MIGKLTNSYSSFSAVQFALNQNGKKDLIVATACGLASYRFGLPMTVRSSLYPIFGEYCWGWIGDVIDGYSIIMTIAGVCTSLGVGAIQIVGTFLYQTSTIAALLHLCPGTNEPLKPILPYTASLSFFEKLSFIFQLACKTSDWSTPRERT